MDACALILAFQTAYWTRFSCPAFGAFFPPWKGIPEYSLYQQTLWALLPMWLLVFFYIGFYRDLLISAYDELILVMKGVFLGALLTTAMTFAYRGAEYSRLVIGLWALYSVLLTYLLREGDKLLFRKLTEYATGPRHVLVIGRGKATGVIQEMAARQPFLRTTFADSPADLPDFEAYCQAHRISEVLLIQNSLPAAAILETARRCEQRGLECKILPDLLEIGRASCR